MNWWMHLSAREKKALFAASAVLFLLVYFLVFWSPVSTKVAVQRQAIAQLEANYRHMIQAAAEMKRLQRLSGGDKPADQTGLTGSLLAKVDSSLRRGGLAVSLQEIKPDGDEALRVSLRKSRFDEVVLWLDYLRSNGIEVTRASFVADDEAGYVQMTAQLRDQRR